VGYKRLEAQGSIERISSNPKQISVNLARARRDLMVARANLRSTKPGPYDRLSCHAQGGRALMFSHGYRPKGKDQHRTVVESALPFWARDSGHS
jgi:hypothetical protein